MARRGRQIRLPVASAIEDAWQRQAMRVAIEKARAVVSGGAVPPMTPIGRLSDIELGWIICAGLFGWISERATQATANGLDTEKTIRDISLEPRPWDAGAIACVLPELADAPIDWTASLSELSRDEMIVFLGAAYTLIDKAMQARELGGNTITRKSPDGTAELADAGLDSDAFVPF
jgi:hypothetical protein